ncbi:unnamed protein product, partial [Owenia fusiformis]
AVYKMAPNTITADLTDDSTGSMITHTPGGPMEIIFSFDTTGSMSSCLAEVRKQVNHIIQRLFMDIPSLKVGVIAHGDYCDATTYYVTKQIDFTNDITALCDFVENTGGSGGGDYAECYELVLQKVRTSFDWTPGSQKSLVMIGDAIPHEPNYPANKGNINWRTETKKLYEELGVKIYGVQCQDNVDSSKFFKQISSQTGGKHLKLAEFQTIIDMMMAICYREHGVEYFEAYEKEVREREGKGMRGELTKMFDALRDPDSHDATDEAMTPIIKRKKKSTPKKAPRKFQMSPKVTPKVTVKTATTTPKLKVVKMTPKTLRVVKRSPMKLYPSSTKIAKIPRHNRENVAEIHFSSATLAWSPWKPVSNILEFRSIYSMKQNQSRSKSFLYELAVQTKPYTRRFPVYIKLATRCLHSTNGALRMYINNDEIREQLENVEKQGCKLFARCLEIKRPVTCYGRKFTNGQDLKKFLVKSYDYAWNLKSMKRSEARNVVQCGVVISRGSE